MPFVDFLMRLFLLNVDEGCSTSVCASTLPLEMLSGECAVGVGLADSPNGDSESTGNGLASRPD